ncbi:hypothetical protein, partial [Brevibacillus panacihumi]|uniref:hypothetical protein n=1 Tax=Brevibacillus panacihumi TaxID=497735 RepID=UPI003D1FE153
MKISLSTIDRYFEAFMHFAVVETDSSGKNNCLIAASYVGLETSVRAISAGIIESREVQIESKATYSRSTKDKYRRIERPIGLGDVVHGMVLNSRATINGLEEAGGQGDAYIFASDGDLQKAFGEHISSRFGLPNEWLYQYEFLFRKYLKPLQIIRNPMTTMWDALQVVKLSISEEEVLKIVSRAIQDGYLEIPQSIINGTYTKGMNMQEESVKSFV